MNAHIREMIIAAFDSAKRGDYAPLEDCPGSEEETLLACLDEAFFMIAHRDFRQNQEEAIKETAEFLDQALQSLPDQEERMSFSWRIIPLRQGAR